MKCKNKFTFLVRREKNRLLGSTRIASFMLSVLVLSLLAETSFAQPLLPPLNLNNMTISQVFSAIEKESDYVFLIADDVNRELEKKISLRTNRQAVTEVISQALRDTGLAYAVTGNQITVFKETARGSNVQQPQAQNVTVGGTVRDEKGNALVGVAVYLKSNPQRGTVTDAAGRYTISVPAANSVLVFSYVGMNQQEVAVRTGVTAYDVKMVASTTEIEGVTVSTGLFVRDRVTYTSNIASFTGDELRAISNSNVLQSLAVLDPSFILVDDLNAGSNPNATPNIEIRGQGAAVLYAVQDEFSTDPNQPLFILNGVEVSYSRIRDLDPNRIQSANILKDAGATAIYGSKGANGVLVIETIKPKTGEYHAYYNGTYSVKGADLSVYNMMNAKEKLEFERLSGKYHTDRYISSSGAQTNLALNKLYNHFLGEIERGVDTYWLSEPVRSPFSHSHSVRVNGGSEELSLDVGARYSDEKGPMKGNDLKSWGGNVSIVYRAGKFIVSNDTDVNGSNSYESPYGSFSNWVNASPYFRKYNEEGGIDKWLMYKWGYGSDKEHSHSAITRNIPNPMWNANLNSKNESDYLNVQNNLQIQYDINEYLRASGKFTLRREQTQRTIFKDPEHTDFDTKEAYQKGTYWNRESKSTYYFGQASLAYGQNFDLHTVGANAYIQIGQTTSTSLTTEAEGFPKGTKGSPNLAHAYKRESYPGYGWVKRRSVGALVAFNYDYDRRYLLDFTYRLDGATTFGSNKLFKPFWSAGLGWNINREGFAAGWKKVDLMRLTATIGTTGNQNIGKVNSKSVYQYFVDSNVFGQAAYLAGLGAPDLPWQVNRKIDLKLEMRMFKGQLSFWVDLYREKTKPLIINVNQIPSTGLDSFPMDMGSLTKKGVEYNVAFSPVYNLEQRIFWTIRINGSYKTDEYDGFDNRLDNLNKTMRESNTLQQYRDGYSQHDIWGVKSYGIDPATGQEVFIKKDGRTLTFDYSADDWVKIGNDRPDLEGNLQTSFQYKNFKLSVALKYFLGEDIYNSALYNKVENIKKSTLENNQDKRALYDRWKKAGDKARFRSIKILTDNAPKTSRFVQKNNFLRTRTINLSYELNQSPWLRRNLAVRNMTVSFGMDELFRFETAKYERGYDSPFARTFTLGLNLSF